MVDLVYKYGLIVDVYIGYLSDLYIFGIVVEIFVEVVEVVKKMEELGVDMIGLMIGMSYEGVSVGDIFDVIK